MRAHQEEGASMAKAYLAGFLTLRDPAWLDEYQSKNLALVERHGGRYLVAAPNPIRLEGRNPPDILIVMEFPSREAATAWYGDPDYQPLIRLRQLGADLEFVLAEGLA
jgi:uncharacterized protein (DUF1330 family)